MKKSKLANGTTRIYCEGCGLPVCDVITKENGSVEKVTIRPYRHFIGPRKGVHCCCEECCTCTITRY